MERSFLAQKKGVMAGSARSDDSRIVDRKLAVFCPTHFFDDKGAPSLLLFGEGNIVR